MNNKHLLIVSLALIVSVTLNVVGGFFIFAGVQSVEELRLAKRCRPPTRRLAKRRRTRSKSSPTPSSSR